MAKKSQKSQGKKKAAQRKILLIVVIVLIIASGAGAFVILNQKKPVVPVTNADKTQQEQIIAADQKAQNEGAAKGAELFDDAIAKTADAKEKSELMASKATLFLNEEKYEQALTYALQADSLHTSAQVSALVAQLYEQLKNKSKAAQYYEKAAQNVDPENPMAKDDKAYYESMAKQLGGAQ